MPIFLFNSFTTLSPLSKENSVTRMVAMKRFSFLLLFILAISLFTSQAVYASLISFDFNPLVDGASNASVQTYMNNLLASAHPGGHVVVTGALGERNYTGDNHVVGPILGGGLNRYVAPLTLGSTDGGILHVDPLDTFLVNNTNTDRIVMQFDFPIYRLLFDYEIFPDATCPAQTVSCGPTSVNWPDFSFRVDGSLQFRTLAINPSTTGPYQHSPDSGLIANELAPQFLGQSGEWFFPNGVTSLDFIDWPRLIGIDNLQIYDSPPIPEPASVLLIGSGLIGLALKRRFLK